MPRSLALIIHDVRSANNVGSMLRTAEGLGVEKVFLTGITPFPAKNDDLRLPHVSRKVNLKIRKTALGAEEYIDWAHEPVLEDALAQLKADNFEIVALEQAPSAIPLPNYICRSEKLAVLVGNELCGLNGPILDKTDKIIYIPMLGKKESFNVAVAAAITLYTLKS